MKNASTIILEWVNTDRAQLQALSSALMGERMSLNDSLMKHEEERWEKHFEQMRKKARKSKPETNEKNQEKPA